MTSEERQKRVEEHLSKVEFASLDELSQLVGASVSTVRRDLDLLEGKGILRRTHGGAMLTNPKSDEFTFSARDTHQLSEKEAIGEACARLILPNQTVIVDAGTTCFRVARHLEAKNPHIVTNSLPVANAFSSSAKMEVVVTGGLIYPRLGVLVGSLAVASLAEVHADVAIMSCGGITTEVVTNSHGLLIEIQRAMMAASQRIILCVDHTKFGRQSISKLCDLDDIDVVITNELPSPEMRAALDHANVGLIVASANGAQNVTKQSDPPVLGGQSPISKPARASVVQEETFID